MLLGSMRSGVFAMKRWAVTQRNQPNILELMRSVYVDLGAESHWICMPSISRHWCDESGKLTKAIKIYKTE